VVAVESPKPAIDVTHTTLIEVWDIENASLVETFITRTSSASSDAIEPQVVAAVEADNNPAAAIAALVRSRQSGSGPRRSSQSIPKDSHLAPSADVRAIVGGLEFGGHTMHRPDVADIAAESITNRLTARGFMITGSEDRKIRLWDLGKLERTTILSGLESEHHKPSFRYSPVPPTYISGVINVNPLKYGSNKRRLGIDLR
jgi:phosphoinositide-3-kinase regulatory subunit 4